MSIEAATTLRVMETSGVFYKPFFEYLFSRVAFFPNPQQLRCVESDLMAIGSKASVGQCPFQDCFTGYQTILCPWAITELKINFL